jgi:hypoxanthine phosphoribosyltransferase
MDRVKVWDKVFEKSISSEVIQEAVRMLGERINHDLEGKEVVFVGILNGSFMFAADLFRQIRFNTRITFVKLASYEGTASTGKVVQLIGINEDLAGKTVVILEDIVDTGHTLTAIIKYLESLNPAEIKIATMLFKPEAYQGSRELDYVGLEIPNKFIIGYGLDYNGYARNLADIYALVD